MGRYRWLSGFVDRIEKHTKFLLAGNAYEHANPAPQLAAGSVHRFPPGTEPEVIAQVPLAGCGTVEIHGYATHYTQEWVTIEWNDDNIQHFDCWTPAGDVRRQLVPPVPDARKDFPRRLPGHRPGVPVARAKPALEDQVIRRP